MRASATILHNAMTYGGVGGKHPLPAARPTPSVRGGRNRHFWASPDAGGSIELAAAVNAENLRQGLDPINVLNPYGLDRAAWNLFCWNVAPQLIKQGVSVVELCNEADAAALADLSVHPKALGELARVGHDVFGTGHGLKVIAGSFIGIKGRGLETLRYFLDGFDGPPTAIAAHLYTGTAPVESWGDLLQQFRGVLVSFGCAMTELLVTEWGHEPGAQGQPAFADWAEKAQKAFIRAGLRQQLGADVAESLFFALDSNDRAHGAFGFDNLTNGRRIWNAGSYDALGAQTAANTVQPSASNQQGNT